MPTLYGLQEFRFGLAKEGTRLTAESAPSKWHPIFDFETSYGPALLPDNALRGVKAEFPPIAGRKLGSGKFKMYLDPQTIGEYFNSLLGGLVSAQQGGSAAYQHTITPAANKQPTTYTFFVDYGLAVKKYNGCVVKSLTFTGPVDGLISVDVEFLCLSEASGSIGSPSFPTQRYFSFQHVVYKIAGSDNTNVKSWTLKIDNMAKHVLTLAASQDAQDIISVDPMEVTGDMEINFTAETERNKFLANTAVALRMLMEGATIASTYKYTVDLPLTEAHYSAYPFGYQDNLLAAKVNFKGYHNGTSQIIPVVINTETSY